MVILNHLLTVAVQAAPAIVLGLLLWLSSASRDVRLGWIGVAAGLILLHDVAVTSLWAYVPQPASWGQWNWTGVLLALAATLTIASLRQFGLERVGFRVFQDEGSGMAWLAAGIALVGLLGILLIVGGNGYQGTDTLVFQTVLVPAQEEFFYRGILFFALDRAFLERRTHYGAELGPAVLLTAVYFACCHAISRTEGGTGFDIQPPLFGAMLAAGLFLGWLRARTGSLLAPTLTRAVGNAMLAVL